MSGVAFTTISPSSTNSRRSTPCVEGCCGPIEIVICVSSGRSTISNCGGILAVEALMKFRVSSFEFRVRFNSKPETLNSKLFQAVRFIASQRKILPQCMSLPVVGQKNAAQIGMTVEDHAEQIVSLPFVPVCGAPDAGHGRHMRVCFVQQHLQPHPVILCRREQVIVHFEAGLFFRPAIKPAQIS